MAITNYAILRASDTVTVTVTSDLTGSITYHWYLDGEYAGSTVDNSNRFRIPFGQSVGIECRDTIDPDFDPWLSAPQGYPADRIIAWSRSADTTVTAYKVEQKVGTGEWTAAGLVSADRRRFRHTFRAINLLTMSTYTWRITPIGTGGVEGTSIEIGPEFVVRVPLAPVFAVSFDEETSKVTFT